MKRTGLQRSACILAAAALLVGAPVSAQETRDLGLPPASGSQNPVLPPPSGSQNPVLPPQSGQRFQPGIGGPFGGRNDIPGQEQRPIRPDSSARSLGDSGLVGSVSPETKPAQDGDVDSVAQVGPALQRCWLPPPLTGTDTGVMATVRFSLRRDGTLFGQPRLTWRTQPKDPKLRDAFGESVVRAVRRCTPMRLSPGFGASIAGRPFTIRFHGSTPSNERST